MVDVAAPTLKRRIFTAGGWTVAGYALSQTSRFGSHLFMTRLLVPEMFGVMTIAIMVMVGLAMFSDLGLKQNIVQSKRGDEATYLDTAWIFQIMRGLALCCIALGVALLIILFNRHGSISGD